VPRLEVAEPEAVELVSLVSRILVIDAESCSYSLKAKINLQIKEFKGRVSW
jgi:hypothetical protein